jgi:hypothetical protein
MKKTSLVSLFVFCFLWPFLIYAQSANETVLKELDNVIANKATWQKNKENYLRSIKSLLASAVTGEQRFGIYAGLYNEYNNYSTDSALVYAEKKLKLARELNNTRWINESVLDIANLYYMSGMYVETLELVRMIDRKSLSEDQYARYYHVFRSTYGGLRRNCISPEKAGEYQVQIDKYRDSLKMYISEDDISHLYVVTDYLIEKGEYDSALQMLLKKYADSRIGLHEKAVLAYSLSQAYLGLNNNNQAEYYLALSAINDITTPVREYRSLQELAALIYERGDISRAYNYINCAVNDATSSNARTYLPAMTDLLPIINKAYEDQLAHKRMQQNVLLLLMALVIITLTVLMSVVSKQKGRLAEAQRQQHTINLELQKVNEELQTANGRLRDINNRLLETNNIKTAYLGRYMDSCSDYIGCVEKYRGRLMEIARRSSTSELVKEIKSSTFVEDELRDFYNNFDATFLHLFPNFIEQFNALLSLEEQIVIKKGRLLNSELRIFALIRLGITDSVKIAEFLRFSVSTVYNYRVKFRNAAITGRDNFEEEVMKIGQI